MLQQVEKWDTFEFGISAEVPGNPFLEVHFSAEFIHQHRSVRVTGFYDGDGVYKLRFMPDMEGAWHFVTHSDLAVLEGQRGEFTCSPATLSNHGPVRVIDRYHFAYADGTPYHPVGTTCYVWSHQGNQVEEQTLATLKSTPFNKLRMCVFPKRFMFNINEPPAYPFEGEVKRQWDPKLLHNFKAPPPAGFWDFDCFNPGYFAHLEKRILNLRDLGIQADLILFHPYDSGAWGFDQMPPEVNKRYLRYLVARISAFRNVWWSFANEYDLMFTHTSNDWDDYFKLVQDEDPYDHLRSVHNWIAFYDHRKPWVTHCSIQSRDLYAVPHWLEQYGKPVVVDECGYEGDIQAIWGSLSAEEMVLRHWLGFTCGGYVGHGETYWNEEEQLWWSKGGELHGESAPRLAFLRQVIESVPGPGLSPLVDDPVTRQPVLEGGWNLISAGQNGKDYYLFYFGMQQPRFLNFTLPEGHYQIDILDTWNMTVESLFDNASGQLRLELPQRKYLAVRVERANQHN